MSDTIKLKRPKESSYDEEKTHTFKRGDFPNSKRVLYKDVVSKAKEIFAKQDLNVLLSLETGVGVNINEELDTFVGQEFLIMTEKEWKDYLESKRREREGDKGNKCCTIL